MQTSQWIGLCLLLVIFAFVAFAFKRSLGTKADGGGRSSGWNVNRIANDPTALASVIRPAWKAVKPKPSCSSSASRKTEAVVPR